MCIRGTFTYTARGITPYRRKLCALPFRPTDAYVDGNPNLPTAPARGRTTAEFRALPNPARVTALNSGFSLPGAPMPPSWSVNARTTRLRAMLCIVGCTVDSDRIGVRNPATLLPTLDKNLARPTTNCRETEFGTFSRRCLGSGLPLYHRKNEKYKARSTALLIVVSLPALKLNALVG